MSLATRPPVELGRDPRGSTLRWDAASVVVWMLVTAAGAWIGWEIGRDRVGVTWPPLVAHSRSIPATQMWLAVLPTATALAGLWVLRRTVSVSWPRAAAIAMIVAFGWILTINVWHPMSGDPGTDGLTHAISLRYDYPAALETFDGPWDVWRDYVEETPDLPTHPSAHPPATVFLLEVLPMGAPQNLVPWAIAICLMWASAAVAVADVVRRLAGEPAARAALPVLALAPHAIWAGVMFDGLFLAAAAWVALAWLVARRPLGHLAAGAGGGFLLLLSYGLAPFGLVLLALRRDRRALLWGAAGAAAVLLGAWGLGFGYPDGIRAAEAEYWAGKASFRPYGYWLLGNVAAAAFACGPMVAPALRRMLGPGPRSAETGWRTQLGLVVTAALAALLLLDLSGRTKAEAERIWLPYFPWLLAAAGAWGLGVDKRDALRNGTAVAAAQAVYAIVLSAMLVTLW